MLFESQLITKASGSVGGMTASHNRYGQYMRARSTPVNPQTALQTVVRSALATLAAGWGELTGIQRTSWSTYAENVPVLNKLGNSVNLTGFNMYLRSNIPRIQIGLDVVDDGPTEFSLPVMGLISLEVATGGVTYLASTTYDDALAWVDDPQSALIVYGSTQQSPTINFFKGPFRLLGHVPGDGTTPPTAPFIIAGNGAAAVGNRVYSSTRLTLADGRLSSAVVSDAIVTA